MHPARRSSLRLAVIIAASILPGAAGARQGAPPARDAFDIRALRVQGFDSTSVYMLVGAGANIAVQIGDEGVVVVDTGTTAAADAVLAAIRRLTDKPIKYIINTHAHPDHVGGNAVLVKASGGQRTDAGPAAELRQNPNGVIVVAHQNAIDRMLRPPRGDVVYPEYAVARSSFITADKQLHFNGEAIELWWHPSAHTDADVLVYFRRSDVIVGGDLVQPATFPQFDVQQGGRLQGMINGVNHVIDLAVPQFNQSGGTRIIPGHGWLCTESDVVELRDMATIARDRVRHLLEKKLTLREVLAARLLADFAPVYGEGTADRATDAFVEAVYSDLQKPWDGPGPVAGSGLNFIDGGR
jgi:glyoxylase-like metal-dependent hydrolase (beta-lactamase superfamily II)